MFAESGGALFLGEDTSGQTESSEAGVCGSNTAWTCALLGVREEPAEKIV